MSSAEMLIVSLCCSRLALTPQPDNLATNQLVVSEFTDWPIHGNDRSKHDQE